MRKRIITIILIITTILFISPVNTRALSIDSVSETIISNVYLLDNEQVVTQDIEECVGSNSIFGDPTDEDTVAWLIQQIMNYIKVIGPILVLLLSSIDFIKVIVKSDDDAMAKAKKKLIIRLILAVLLFLIPTLVQALLGVYGISSDPTCGIQ